MTASSPRPAVPTRGPASGTRGILEVTAVFGKLGLISFGGPAAHIAMMHDEVVRRRAWVNDEEFLDIVGATNLLPGPNSTEMAMHLGSRRAGFPGLLLGGAAFILPPMLIVLALSYLYVRLGSTTQAGWLLYGIKPVVIAIIVDALIRLGRKTAGSAVSLAVAAAALLFSFAGASEIPLLLAGGAIVMIAANRRRILHRNAASILAPFSSLGLSLAAAAPFSLPLLFLTFLKIGAVLYGSGYVLFAFLQSDLVERLGWLTPSQLVDAVAIGQITPGPLFTSATFIGYLLAGIPGAVIATVGIFLPAFVFAAAATPLIPRIRASSWARTFLDGVVAASLGLIGAVAVDLGRAALVDAFTVALAAASLVLLLRSRVNSAWLVAGGAAAGMLAQLVR